MNTLSSSDQSGKLVDPSPSRFEETFECYVNLRGTAFLEDGNGPALCDLYLYSDELSGKTVEITIKVKA